MSGIDLGFSVFLANDELGTGLRVTERAFLVVTHNFAVPQDDKRWSCCGTCCESVCYHQPTLDLLNDILTFVSMGTFLLPTSTSITVKLVLALLVEDAVIIVLFKGEPLAVDIVVAFFYAFLQGGYIV